MEVSDDGVISYTASDDLLASLQEGEAATDSIYYAVRDGSESFSVNIAEVTIRLEKGEVEYEGIANLTATGAKQLAARASENGISAADARAMHEEVDYLLGTEASPGLVREHVTAVSDALEGASGSVNLILGTLGIDADSAEAPVKSGQQLRPWRHSQLLRTIWLLQMEQLPHFLPLKQRRMHMPIWRMRLRPRPIRHFKASG